MSARTIATSLAVFVFLTVAACSGSEQRPGPDAPPVNSTETAMTTNEIGTTPNATDNDPSAAQPSPAGTELATFGGGCYWCVEAVFERLDGVLDAKSGFMGGDVDDPSYDAVCAGITGHAEVVQLTFDPERISYETLLEWFWKAHDPTTLNRQGADIGTQYRSAIFTHSEEQAAAARRSMKQADESGAFDAPIVTEIAPAATLWLAKEEHQDFYSRNPRYGYCRAVITPKMKKLGLEK